MEAFGGKGGQVCASSENCCKSIDRPMNQGKSTAQVSSLQAQAMSLKLRLTALMDSLKLI
jgi:hypothetical protein